MQFIAYIYFISSNFLNYLIDIFHSQMSLEMVIWSILKESLKAYEMEAKRKKLEDM